MKAKITASGLNLRSTPEIGNNIVTILKKTAELDVVLPGNNGWTKVKWGVYIGFVATKHIEIIPDAMPVVMTLADRAVQIAISQLGNSEIPKGSNWGKHVEKYLKSVNLHEPAFWCAAFVYWCYDEAAKEMGVANLLPKTAGVLDMWNKAPKSWRVEGTPQKGDIGILDFGKGKGHMFIVTSATATKCQTVEGNSNDDGSRNGTEVCRKPGGRIISSCKGFLRLP